MLTRCSPTSSPSRAPLVLVLSFLIGRAFEYVEARGAVMTVAKKVPFFTAAHPTSHRVRLWRGESIVLMCGGGKAGERLLQQRPKVTRQCAICTAELAKLHFDKCLNMNL